MTLNKVFFYHIHGNVKSLRPSLFIVSEGRSEYSVTQYIIFPLLAAKSLRSSLANVPEVDAKEQFSLSPAKTNLV